VFHAVRNLIRPMVLAAWLGANRSDTRGIARICNDVTRPKTRSYVPHSVKHCTRALWLAFAIAACSTAVLPCQAATITPDQVSAATDAVKHDPKLGGMHRERKLRWMSSDVEEKKREAKPVTKETWVDGLALWLAESGRLLMWLLGAAAVAILLVCVRRWVLVHGGFRPGGHVTLPSHVRDLDIRPESLPDDIASAARALWLRGEHRASLSLLYRGALSRLVHHHAVPISAASTEGDCVALAGKVLPKESGAFFERLVNAWLLLVYGAQMPDEMLVMSLCDRFDAQLPVAAPAAGAAA